MKKITEKLNKFRDLLADSIWGNVFVFIFMGVLMYGLIILAQKYDSSNFKCPKEYSTNEAYLESINKWTDDELLKNPEVTEEELTDKRAKLFAKHNCEKGNWVTRDELENNTNDLDTEKLMGAIKKVESEEPPRISEHPTEEEIYNSEYIKHVRVAFNGYLHGDTSMADEPLSQVLDSGNKCGLNSFDKSYYKSKFIVIAASDSDYGGVQASLFFIDKPDTLFWAWVYKAVGEDNQDEYQLRAFCEDGPAPEEKVQFDDFTEGMIKNSKYSL